jgi:hypothetical protein
MTGDATARENPVVSVRVDDIDAAYVQARERGYEIIHPLTTEEWGVTRFFVRAPDGESSTSCSTAIDLRLRLPRGAATGSSFGTRA